MWSHTLISTFAWEAAITALRHGVGLDRPINVLLWALKKIKGLLTHFSFQYRNKGTVFDNSLLPSACCHCSKLFYFGGDGCVQKETAPVGMPCLCQWEAWPHSQVLLLDSFSPHLKIKSPGGWNWAPPALHLSRCQACTVKFGMLVLGCDSAKCWNWGVVTNMLDLAAGEGGQKAKAVVCCWVLGSLDPG